MISEGSVPLTKPAPIARMARLPVTMCLANTDGPDGRARTEEWGKDHSSDAHANSFTRCCRTVCRRHAVAAIDKGMILAGDVLIRLL